MARNVKQQEKPKSKRGRKPGYKLPPPTLSPSSTIIRPNQIPLFVGFSKSTAYRLEAAGQFPKRIKMTSGTSGWLRSSIEAWLTERNAA